MGKINFKRAAAKAAGVSAGVIGGQKLVPMIPVADRRVKGGLMILAGALLSELAASNSKGMVADLGEGSGMGIVAAGATEMYAGFTEPKVSGMYGDDDEMSGYDDDEMSGMYGDDEEEMSGADDDQSLDGIDDEPMIEGGEGFISGHHKKHNAPKHHHRHEEEENEEEEEGEADVEEENAMYGQDEDDVLIN